MTFDEFFKKYGVDEDSDFEYLFSQSELVDIVRTLCKEYAPTVEMTKKQFHSFKLWKYHTAGWNMTNCAEWARDEDITANNAMRAWLHPETIIVIGEDDDTAKGSRNED